ncbi:MAG TPA: hypothetical protein VIJ76_01045, partial [Galbitalea sp.]
MMPKNCLSYAQSARRNPAGEVSTGPTGGFARPAAMTQGAIATTVCRAISSSSFVGITSTAT